MIRKFFYTILIGISLFWGALKYYGSVLGQPIDLASYLQHIPGALEAMRHITLSATSIDIMGWICLGLTAILYLIGLVNIYRHADNDPWRAILFTIGAIVVSIGVVFFQMQLRDMIDSSSLYLIALMTAPFAPAVLILPFMTTFKDYLSAAK